MKRRIFNFAAWLSMVLCLIVIVLWARGYGGTDQVHFNLVKGPGAPSSRYLKLWSGGGTVGVSWGRTARSRIQWARDPSRPSSPIVEPIALPTGIMYRRLPPHADLAGVPASRKVAGFGWRPPQRVLTEEVGRSPTTRVGWETRTAVVAPSWFIVIALAILPLWKAARLIRDRKSAGEFRCPACGYDLRGRPGTDCPECGAASRAGAPEAKA